MARNAESRSGFGDGQNHWRPDATGWRSPNPSVKKYVVPLVLRVVEERDVGPRLAKKRGRKWGSGRPVHAG